MQFFFQQNEEGNHHHHEVVTDEDIVHKDKAICVYCQQTVGQHSLNQLAE